ncbi:MAG: hypothetical protein WBG37_10115 [Desulfobacterales bacterium]
MSDKTEDKSSAKAALKALRGARKPLIKAATVQMKRQKKAIQAITDQLQGGAQTVPEIAAATGASSAETLWYVAALKKYGRVKEVEKDGGYFKYALSEVPEAASAG